jgi:predicted dinucleotide-binding enzyme
MTTETPIDTIEIIGAGHARQASAPVALRAGRKVRFANSRGTQSLGPVVEALGPARRPADR